MELGEDRGGLNGYMILGDKDEKQNAVRDGGRSDHFVDLITR